ncbi:hypothetical protein WN943_013936 [Citrus x changshan-huyou]
MKFVKALPISSALLIIISITLTHAAKFDITNNCPDTVWAAAVPGGGRQLDKGQTWTITAEPGTKAARIWARTKCQFDASGKGKCETGDCNGLLECQGYGAAPNTLAEYALKQFNDMDFIDMSNIDGFNVPMEFSSVSPSCNRVIKCTANILGECPNELKVPGGCNGPCPVFKTDEYCCNSGNCGPTGFSKFFKDRCPDVYSYPKDDATSTFTCPTGTDYKDRVVFTAIELEQAHVVIFILWSTSIDATVFEVQNNCSYTVWAAANPSGGRELYQGQSWIVNTDPNFNDIGRIWARINCRFNVSNGTGKCESGDCNGVLYCVSDGAPPVILAEYSFQGVNNMGFFDVSVVDGFNVPIEFKGTSSGCNKVIKCRGDINGLCPTELRHPGGCNHPCSVLKNDQFCCTCSNSTATNCGPTTAYFKIFKDLCPDAYSYALDDATSTFTCPTGTDYKVVFCP